MYTLFGIIISIILGFIIGGFIAAANNYKTEKTIAIMAIVSVVIGLSYFSFIKDGDIYDAADAADAAYIKARSWRINAPKRAEAIAKLKKYESCWELPKKLYGQKYSNMISWKNVKGYHNQIMGAINSHDFKRVEKMFSEYEEILYRELSYIESVHNHDKLTEIMDTLENKFKAAGLECERDSYNHITMK